MERAKKMVLISTDNLERLQQQADSLSSSSTSSAIPPLSSTNNAAIGIDTAATAAAAAGNNENTVRTPGTVLSRLDTEMHRILNSPILGGAREKWRLYREVLQRYLYFFREREKHRLRGKRDDKPGNGDGGEKEDDDNGEADDHVDKNIEMEKDENVDVDTAEDIPDLETDSHRTLNASQRERNDTVSFSRHRRRRTNEQKSIGRILNKVPKSYRAKTRKLLAHLCDVAVPGRLSWDRQGLVTVDNRILRGSNIIDLLNDAARERKSVRAVARARFVRLLREVSTPPEFVGNRKLLEDDVLPEENDLSARLRETLPRGSSTPLPTTRAQPQSKRVIDETSLEEKDRTGERSLFVACNQNRNKTLVSGDVSKSTRKRRMLDWNPLESCVISSTVSEANARGLPLVRGQARKRALGESSFREDRDGRSATFITSDQYKYKTRVNDNVSKSSSKRRLINWNTLE